jgi:hypothetical protein
VVIYIYNPSTQEQRQKYLKFEVSLSYIGKPCLKKREEGGVNKRKRKRERKRLLRLLIHHIDTTFLLSSM